MNNNITEAALLVSEMNPNMEIIIIPKESVGFHNWFSISSTANNAYHDWFENERDDIKGVLNQEKPSDDLISVSYTLDKDEKDDNSIIVMVEYGVKKGNKTEVTTVGVKL